MCDPFTLIAGALGALGGATAGGGSAPPAAVLPAPDTQDAKAETGADIILGGERDEDEDGTSTSSTTNTTKTTSSSGLSTASKSSGLSIL